MKAAILTAIAAIVLVIFSCSNERGGFFSKMFGGGGTGVPVTVESVVPRESSEIISVPATIEAPETAEISTPQDVSIERVLVTDGEHVNAGDSLARISEDELNMRLSKLRSDLREAQLSLEKNSYLFRNRDRLLEEDRIDQSQYENLEIQVQMDESIINQVKQEISKLETKLTDLIIKAPIAGVVSRRAASITGQTNQPLLSIIKSDPASVLLHLKPQEAAFIKTGLPIKVKIPASTIEPAEGKISSVDAQMNPSDQTLAAHAQVANTQGFFKAGMRVDVEFKGSRIQSVYLIPRNSIIHDDRNYFVFTVAKGVAHKVQVLPSNITDKYVEISRGLKDDDMVVVRGQEKLTDGTAVDIWKK